MRRAGAAHARPLARCGRCRRPRCSAPTCCAARSTWTTPALAAATDDASLVEAAGGTVRRRGGLAGEPQGHHPARPRAWRRRCSSPMLTDYHVHLRPDEDDTPAERLLHPGERRALPRGGVRARDRGAGRGRAHPPLRAGPRRLDAPVVAAMGPRRPRRVLRVRARADRPQAGHRGRLRAGPRGPDGHPARRARLGLRGRLGPLPARRGRRHARQRMGRWRGGDPEKVWARYFETLGEAARTRDVRHPRPPRPREGLGRARAGARRRPAPLLRARDGRHRRVRRGDRGLDRRPAQAGRRDLPGAGVPRDVPRGRAAGGAVQRRPPARAPRPRVRARRGVAAASSA